MTINTPKFTVGGKYEKFSVSSEELSGKLLEVWRNDSSLREKEAKYMVTHGEDNSIALRNGRHGVEYVEEFFKNHGSHYSSGKPDV